MRTLLVVFLTILLSVLPSLSFTRAADHVNPEPAFRELTRDAVFRDDVKPTWLQDGERCWYRVRTSKDSFEFVLVDALAGSRTPAFDHARLAGELGDALNRKVEAANLPFDRLEFDNQAQAISFYCEGRGWSCDLSTYALTMNDAVSDESSRLPTLRRLRPSQSGGEETFVRFFNRLNESVDLYWVDTERKRHAYGTIKSGQSHEQRTFAGHVWLVERTSDKQPVALFAATDSRKDAVIDGTGSKIELRSRRGRGQAPRSGERPGVLAPNGRWRATINDHNVQLWDEVSGESHQLSQSGTEEDPFIDRLYWSPDSQKLVAIQRRVGQDRTVHMIESSPEDQLQPKLHSMTYAKPGDRLPLPRPRLFNVDRRERIPVSDELFPNAWSVSELRWKSDSSRFTFLYNQRGHQVLRIIAVDAETGETGAIIDERSATFIDYAYKKYSHYVEDKHEIVWMSERDGWNHLYLIDALTGQVKRQITSGNWVVRGVERVDPDQRRVLIRASGVYPGQDPYYIHYGVVDFDDGDVTWLTSGNGTHSIEYSPDGRFIVDRYSRVDLPEVVELRRSDDGTLICELERADWTELVSRGWRSPKRFRAKARDGESDIYGVVYFPNDFDTERSYPIIEKIYAGPHGSFVPKSFAAYRRTHALAQLGFVVVQIDGLGTSNRSKAFHDVCWKNLGDGGFPDRIRWMKAAAKVIPQIDLTRVGIYGGSAGGQSTLRALLAHGEFYKVGVADCGCHDNRMDKVWWNELWMGWPLGPHYAEQSNVTQAHRLTGKLLLTVGELDRNVDPASTMQVVDALIKADKDFDFLLVPGAGHGVGESDYANRRRQKFFIEHLRP